MVLVTGATGLVGSYIARYLVQSGVQVRALHRKSSQFDLLGNAAKQIEWAEGDLLDIGSLQDAMKGVDKVYHCGALISFAPKDQNNMLKINGEGTANVVNVALDADVKKLLHVSSVVSLGKGKTEMLLDESEENIDADYDTVYGLSKCLGEMEVWRGMMEGLDAVIINPSLILGGGYWDSYGPGMFKGIARRFPFYAPGATGFVDVRDVAKAAIMLMDGAYKNERYIVSAENLSYHAVAEMIADAMRIKKPNIRIPKAALYVMAQLEVWRSRMEGRPPMIAPQNVHLLYQNYRYSNHKLITNTGYQFIPIADTVAETSKLYQETIKEGKNFGLLPL